MKIWLIRHGLTRLGEEKRYQGRIDEGLSEKGRAELQRAEDVYLEKGEVRNPERFPAHVYVSPALRARETASILFPGAEQIIIPGLREMDFGAFDGRGWWEMEEDAAYRAWVDGGCLGRCPGGEDRASFSGRVCAAFQEILKREISAENLPVEAILAEKLPVNDIPAKDIPNENIPMENIPVENIAAEDISADSVPASANRGGQIVIVAHGGTQMALLSKWGRPAREYFSWQTPCGCGWLLEMEEETGMLDVLEEVSFTRHAS